MKVAEVAGYGDADRLHVVDRVEPGPEPGAVRIRQRAAVVDPVDLAVRSGALAEMTPDLPIPFVLGFEFAGELLDDADGLRAGQRVAGFIPWLELADGRGSNAEVILVRPEWLAPIPDGLDLFDAATVPLNALTAAQSLDLLAVARGQTVLVISASGAVGGFATQLAVDRGARVIAVAAHDDVDHVRALGADVVIPRAEPGDMVAAVRRAAPDGVDALLDAVPLGGPLLPAVRDGGAYLTVLAPMMPAEERGIRFTFVHAHPDSQAMALLLRQVAEKRLLTRVAGVLPLDRIAEAHRQVAAGGMRGKLVLTI